MGCTNSTGKKSLSTSSPENKNTAALENSVVQEVLAAISAQEGTTTSSVINTADTHHDSNDSLTVIVVHYNPVQYKRRAALMNECLARLCETREEMQQRRSSSPQLHIVAVELTYDDRPSEIVDRMGVDLIRRRVSRRHVMWSKEQLINLAIRQLPADRKYIAWMDSDIAFHDLTTVGIGQGNWVDDTVECLSQHPRAFAQLWSACEMLGPNGEVHAQVFSFAQQKAWGKVYFDVSNKDHDEYWHPGFVWAATRDALDCTNGLIAKTLGSADRHMAMAFLKRAEETVPAGLPPSYMEQVLNWEHMIQLYDIPLLVVPLHIKHYWHGTLKRRQYMGRWEILKKIGFDLLTHLDYDPEQDLYVWSDDCPPSLTKLVFDYFVQRQEDSSHDDENDHENNGANASSADGDSGGVSSPDYDCHQEESGGGEGNGAYENQLPNEGPAHGYDSAFSGYA